MLNLSILVLHQLCHTQTPVYLPVLVFKVHASPTDHVCQFQVLPDGQIVVESIYLRTKSDFIACKLNRYPFNLDLPTSHRDHTRHNLQKRGLSRARIPHYREHFLSLYRQRHILKRKEAPILLAYILYLHAYKNLFLIIISISTFFRLFGRHATCAFREILRFNRRKLSILLAVATAISEAEATFFAFFSPGGHDSIKVEVK